MANVKIDASGIPKGPVYEAEIPTLHRAGVTAVDASDPADTSGAVDCAGHQHCRFDVTIAGAGFTSLDVQVLFWNSRQSQWFVGASRRLDAVGRHAIVVEARGSIVYLKVSAFSGASFTLDADYVLC